MIRRLSIAAFGVLTLVCLSWAAASPRKANFVVNQTDGGKFNVGQYTGKVVVFAAIMTTCPHCQDTTRALAGLQKEFGSKGLQVLEAAMDQKPDATVPQFIASYNPPFPVGFVNFIDVATFMGIDPGKRFSVPCITFVDRKGMIRGQHQGSDPFIGDTVRDKNIREMVQKLLAEK